jgi:serine/threonine protein kinase
MEYLEGGELYEYWESKPDKRISENEAKEIMLQLLSAVEYCHNSKIVHRDLKF